MPGTPEITLDPGIPIPRLRDAVTVAAPAVRRNGFWVGAPSAVLHAGTTYLAYRVRHPVEDGRGGSVVVAGSRDGRRFSEICRITKEFMDCESLERPALTVTPDGRWRLYLSCATTGTKHWRVEVLEASSAAGLARVSSRSAMPGDADVAVKDPVITQADDGWEAWVCCHPLDDPDATDRMWTERAVSDDGLSWSFQGPVLRPGRGRWDQRGTRVTAVITSGDLVTALYDGRGSAEENWEERTGVAHGTRLALEVQGDAPVAQAAAPHPALRYVSVLALPGGDAVYYEAGCPDGSHELRMEWFARGTA